MQEIFEPPVAEWERLVKRPVFDFSDIESKVVPVLQDVRKNGDEALKRYTEQFDGVALDSSWVSEQEFEAAAEEVDESLKKAIELARRNITKFHQAQKESSVPITTTEGVTCWRKSVPIERVGFYIPGGTAPLFSTILMLGVPARIAGCEEILLCTPPRKDGSVHPVILYAARLLGIDKVLKAGGGQAIAAMAYGTETVPQVYKIFGPGNQYVTAAKQLVNKEGVAIDMPAGPSEVAVLADESCRPDFVASDLLSQAEHGSDSQVVLVSNSKEVLQQVKEATQRQLEALSRKEMAAKALEHSSLVYFPELSTCIDFINTYAPEHLILQVNDPDAAASDIRNAGSVFLGSYTPEAAGDYASGTNHTLPTNRAALAYSGVSLDSFVKKITFQKISKDGLQQLGEAVEIMAEAEGLTAHKNAVHIRTKD